jgi:hypothetical protein
MGKVEPNATGSIRPRSSLQTHGKRCNDDCNQQLSWRIRWRFLVPPSIQFSSRDRFLRCISAPFRRFTQLKSDFRRAILRNPRVSRVQTHFRGRFSNLAGTHVARLAVGSHSGCVYCRLMRFSMDRMQDLTMSEDPCPDLLGRVRVCSQYCGIFIGRDGHGFLSRLIVRAGLTVVDHSHTLLCIYNHPISYASEQVTLSIGKDDWYKCRRVVVKR